MIVKKDVTVLFNLNLVSLMSLRHCDEGRMLAMGLEDGSVVMWNLRLAARARVLDRVGDKCTAIAFWSAGAGMDRPAMLAGTGEKNCGVYLGILAEFATKNKFCFSPKMIYICRNRSVLGLPQSLGAGHRQH